MKKAAAVLWAGALLLAGGRIDAASEEIFRIEQALEEEPLLEAVAFNAVQEAPQEEGIEPAPLPAVEEAVREIRD